MRYHYNSAGYLAKVSESAEVVPATSGATPTAPVAYYTVTAMNARGQVTGATLGNGVVLDRTYQADSGYLHTMKATNGTSQELQKLTLSFDELGNLTKRHDQGLSKLMGAPAKNMEEVFTYDNLNRLLTTRIAGEASANVDTTHDARGNIKTKSGVGAYAYGAASNRLVSVTPSGGTAMTYAYDSNGNLTSGDGRTLSYTSFDKPHTITKGTDQTVKFAYDGERARYKRSVTTGTGTNAVTTTTYYVGNVEIRNVTGGKQYTRYVEGHAIVKLTRNDSSRTAISTDYLITDHLGSIDAIANSSGALLYDLSFDAWGRRRAADSSFAIINTPATALTTLTPRGFTGHEMLDTVGLIHMNGRVYDPRLGRFTSADPIVQFPHYSQSFNHYSYVLNNPLSLTDPSGHFLPVIAGVIAVAQGLTAGYVALTVGIAAFAQALIEGASFGDALFSGISAAALTWAGGALYPGAGAGFGEYASYVATVGTIGGMSSSLQGGKFGHGFLSAGVGGVAGGTLGGAIGGKIGSQFAGRLIGSALVGGTISEVTGGKFANGAANAAFATIARSAVEKAIAAGRKSGSDIFDDTDNLGEGRELYDGQVTVRKHGSPEAVVSNTELNTVSSDLETIFSKGGKGGSQLRSAISSGEPTTIILNDQGVNASPYNNSRILTVDLNTQNKFLNLSTNRFQQFSTTRHLAHELGHAVLGNMDEGLTMTLQIFGRLNTVRPYPNVRFTDGVMSGINGSVRKTYYNGF